MPAGPASIRMTVGACGQDVAGRHGRADYVLLAARVAGDSGRLAPADDTPSPDVEGSTDFPLDFPAAAHERNSGNRRLTEELGDSPALARAPHWASWWTGRWQARRVDL